MSSVQPPARPGTPRPGVRGRNLSQRKGLAIASLILGILSLPTAGLLGIGAAVAIVLGIVALVRANKEPAVYGGKGMAIAGIVLSGLSILLIPIMGIMAAIAIPSLLRARVSANEAVAIGDLRTVVSAQQTYASANGGFFDSLECLSAPTNCIPDYPAAGPTFLHEGITTASVKSGYTRTFYPGAPGQPTAEWQSSVSPTSLAAFAYVAAPEQPGVSGTRAFCADASGRVCSTSSGEMPPVFDGVCPIDCIDL